MHRVEDLASLRVVKEVFLFLRGDVVILISYDEILFVINTLSLNLQYPSQRIGQLSFSRDIIIL